jgi:hypothetical protein
VKSLFQIFLLILLSFGAFAQEKTIERDSLAKLPQLPDSLKSQWHQVDSIRNNFNADALEIHGEYENTVNSIDRETAAVNTTIDSLNNLKLPTSHLTKKLDTLNAKRTEATSTVNSKLASLKSKTVGKLDKIELTPEMQGPVSELKGKMNAANITDKTGVTIPPMEVSGYSIPKMENGSLKGLTGIGDVQTPIGDLGNVTDQMQGVGDDIKKVASGDVKDLENLSTVEQQVEKIDGIKELQDQAGVADEYKEQLGDLGNSAALKEQAMETVQKQAINHFAGKEQVLQAAMDKLDKYKKQYTDVPSIADLPKHPPNAMKGKPFIERLVPGVYFQYQRKDAYLLDVNAYASYKISGRFTAGLGWNQRFVYNQSSNLNDSYYRIFGPRAFFDTRIGKGFVAHLETELMNTFVPSKLVASSDAGRYDWVSSTMLGLKKQYKIYKNLQGTVLIQYNLYNPYFKAPYVDRLNSRIGFEYLLKKKAKDVKKENRD